MENENVKLKTEIDFDKDLKKFNFPTGTTLPLQSRTIVEIRQKCHTFFQI